MDEEEVRVVRSMDETASDDVRRREHLYCSCCDVVRRGTNGTNAQVGVTVTVRAKKGRMKLANHKHGNDS